MTIYKLPEMTVTDLTDRRLAVALGNFDGVHRGHRQLLTAVREEAARLGCASAVWAFTSLLKEGMAGALTDSMEKLRVIAEAGVNFAVLEDFDAVRHLTPAEFAEGYLSDRLCCAAAVCGFNFRFGKGGAGDAQTLTASLSRRGIPVRVIAPVADVGGVVSSTRIRAAVTAGDMETASSLLGRPFSIRFPVVHGHRLGHTIGVPTINQEFPDGHIRPARGIYACVCTVDGRSYAAVTNVGARPTVSDSGRVNCETHILDYDGDLYGNTVRVSFLYRLRDEQRFSDVTALKNRIALDIAEARQYFAAHPTALVNDPTKEDTP